MGIIARMMHIPFLMEIPFAMEIFVEFLFGGCWLGLFNRQGDFSLIVHRQHFDVDLIPYFQEIVDILDVFISYFRNMHESYLFVRKFYECTKFCDPCDGTFYHTAYFNCHAVFNSSYVYLEMNLIYLSL